MGAQAYKRLEEYKSGINGAIVEIGSERGEGSTTFLQHLAMTINQKFWTVDIAQAPFFQTGESWLKHVFPAYGELIGCAYLDNFDWSYKAILNERWYMSQQNEYAAMGFELNNANSQLAHLTQAQRVDEHAAEGCLILFDDTWPVQGGRWDGKGGTAVPWLLQHGYRVVESRLPLLPDEECFDGYVLLRKVVPDVD